MPMAPRNPSLQDELLIKQAQRDDMDTIAKFIRSSASWYEEFVDEKDLNEHYVDDNWKEENFKKRDFYIGHKIDQSKTTPVGTISLQHFGDITYLGYIYLHTDHVGKGYGHKLMDHAREICEKRDQEAMVLIAHPEATWATKAYKKYGFNRKMTQRREILTWKNGLLREYYEEGFHLYHYPLSS
jgi:ribosomal protein S18 acetylase RimI-like enzyme